SDVAPREAQPLAPKAGRPAGLAHVVFHAPDVKATVAWYEQFLGLRASDWLADFMCFMRGRSRKHHCFALLAGPPALNHVSFEMPSTDEMMRGLGRLLRDNVRVFW